MQHAGCSAEPRVLHDLGESEEIVEILRFDLPVFQSGKRYVLDQGSSRELVPDFKVSERRSKPCPKSRPIS